MIGGWRKNFLPIRSKITLPPSGMKPCARAAEITMPADRLVLVIPLRRREQNRPHLRPRLRPKPQSRRPLRVHQDHADTPRNHRQIIHPHPLHRFRNIQVPEILQCSSHPPEPRETRLKIIMPPKDHYRTSPLRLETQDSSGE